MVFFLLFRTFSILGPHIPWFASPGDLRVRSLSIVDETGKTRFYLQASGDYAGFSLRDANEKIRINTGIGQRGVVTSYLDKDERPKIMVSVDEDGNPALRLLDSTDKCRLKLWTSSDSTAGFTQFDSKGNIRVTTGTTADDKVFSRVVNEVETVK